MFHLQLLMNQMSLVSTSTLNNALKTLGLQVIGIRVPFHFPIDDCVSKEKVLGVKRSYRSYTARVF